MALTYTTGMTLVSNADSVTNWDAVRFSGSGSAPTVSAADDFIQGSGAIQSKLAGNNWDSACLFNYYTANGNTVLDLTNTNSKYIAVWINYGLKAKTLTRANGGMYLILSSSTETGTSVPTAYYRYYMDGSDTYLGGWKFYLINTDLPHSAVTGSPNKAQIRRLGFGIVNDGTVGTAKGEPFYIDAMWYGSPKYTIIGDGSTTATWAALRAHSASQANGLVQEREKVYFLSTGVRFGSPTQGATTTFADATGQALVFAQQTYHNGVEPFPSFFPSDIYTIDAAGAASFKTSVTFGTVVGTGDVRQGALGGVISADVPNDVSFNIDFATDIGDLSAVNMYGVQVVGARGGISLDDGNKTKAIGCTFRNCGAVTPGQTNNGAELLNNLYIDPNTGGTLTDANLAADSATNLYTGLKVGVGQSFTAQEGSLNSVSVFLYKVGSPTGNVTISLYTHAGTFGTNSLPSGGALATSNAKSAALLSSTVAALVPFSFATPYKLTKGTKYVIAIHYSGGDASNYVSTFHFSASGASHAGNESTYNGSSWTAVPGADLLFIVLQLRNRALDMYATHNIKKQNFLTTGTPSLQHMVNLPSTSFPYSVSFDGIVYYGSYSGADLWHGQISVNNSGTATLAAVAGTGSNPDAAEFEKDGVPAATVVVTNSVNLTITVLDSNKDPIQNAQVSIFKTSDGTQLMNEDTNASGIATETFNFTATTPVVVRVRKAETTDSPRYKAFSKTDEITSSGLALTITLTPNPVL